MASTIIKCGQSECHSQTLYESVYVQQHVMQSRHYENDKQTLTDVALYSRFQKHSLEL